MTTCRPALIDRAQQVSLLSLKMTGHRGLDDRP
jgi:hypothetical protein